MCDERREWMELVAGLLEEIDQFRTANHHLRGLLETSCDAHDCGGSVTAEWWEEAARAAGGE